MRLGMSSKVPVLINIIILLQDNIVILGTVVSVTYKQICKKFDGITTCDNVWLRRFHSVLSGCFLSCLRFFVLLSLLIVLR